MSATNTQTDIDANNAGVPPAPSEAHQRAGVVEQPKTDDPVAWARYQSEISHRQFLAEHVGSDRHGRRYDCVCVQCRRIREMFGIPVPTGLTTC